MTETEREYVLGTRGEEIRRLGLQHSVWRPAVLDAWQRAGFSSGQTILDVGSGPGFAALDLADLVGPTGKVIALDTSQRFLSHLREKAAARDTIAVETHELDLDTDALPPIEVDAAWCRWVLAFLRNPRRVVQQLARVIRPGGTFVAHEYFSYDTWRFLPPSADLDEFVRIVQASWRATGGEPNIGLEVPGWLREAGFEIISVRPLVYLLRPSDAMWQWPQSFVRVGVERYVDLGSLTRERADQIVESVERQERDSDAMMITPAVLEVIARRVDRP